MNRKRQPQNQAKPAGQPQATEKKAQPPEPTPPRAEDTKPRPELPFVKQLRKAAEDLRIAAQACVSDWPGERSSTWNHIRLSQCGAIFSHTIQTMCWGYGPIAVWGQLVIAECIFIKREKADAAEHAQGLACQLMDEVIAKMEKAPFDSIRYPACGETIEFRTRPDDAEAQEAIGKLKVMLGEFTIKEGGI